jgi:hypothetical protein
MAEEARKRTLIRGGRKLVYLFMREPHENRHDMAFKAGLEKSIIFYDIEPYLSDEFKKKLAFLSRGTFVPPLGTTMPHVPRSFLDELKRLEREWGLTIDPPAAPPPSPSPPSTPERK